MQHPGNKLMQNMRVRKAKGICCQTLWWWMFGMYILLLFPSNIIINVVLGDMNSWS